MTFNKRLITNPLIVTFLFISSICYSQWQQKNIGSSSTLQQLNTIDNNTAILCCSKTEIYKTTNRGGIWSNISPTSLPSKTLIDCSFFGNIGVISALDTFIITTTNLGDEWNTIGRNELNSAFKNNKHNLKNADLVQVSAINLINDTTIIAGLKQKDSLGIYHAYLIKSTDFGLNWDTVSADFANNKTVVVNRISFDNKLGYAVGSMGNLLKTDDSGDSWTIISLDSTILKETYLSDFVILGPDSLLIGSTKKGVVRLYDNLTIAEQLIDESIQDVTTLNDTIYIAAGTLTKMTRSLDAGKTWQKIDNGISSSVFELNIFDQKIWGLSNKGNLYTLNQEEIFPISGDFTINQTDNSIEIENHLTNGSNFTWKISGDTTSIKTGISPRFTFFKKGTYDLTLNATNALGDSIFNRSIEISTISKQWETTTFPSDQTICKLLKFDTNNAVLVNNNLSTLYSNNGGESWLESTFNCNYPTTPANNATIFGDKIAIATYTGTSVDGYLLRSNDMGTTWDSVIVDVPQLADTTFTKFKFYGAKAANDTTGVAILKYEKVSDGSDYYRLIKTIDTGKTWQQFSDFDFGDGSYTSGINEIYVDSTLQHFIICGIKQYWTSNDYGSNWDTYDATEMGAINDITPTQRGYILSAQNGTYLLNGNTTTELLDSYAFDAISLYDSTLITGSKEATTMISYNNGGVWHSFGTGISSTYYELETFGNWVYALRKGSDSYRTPNSYIASLNTITEGVKTQTLSNINIFPNPAQSGSFISINTEAHKVIISDITGKTISVQPIINSGITAPISSGVYLMQIISKNGRNVVKLIIK